MNKFRISLFFLKFNKKLILYVLSVMAKIFLDTEFTSLKKDASLISLALVADNDNRFYAVFNDFEASNLNDFVKSSVIPYLNFSRNDKNLQDYRIKGNAQEIQLALTEWLDQFKTIQIWADVPHYDWVLFCNLFGGALQIPKNIHYMCMDLATLIFSKGIDINTSRIELLTEEEIPKDYIVHNALSDAEVGMLILQKLLKP